MAVIIALLIKELFADTVRKELERSEQKQNSLITTVGLIALELV